MDGSEFDPNTTGLIIVDHGSRRQESNALLLEAAEAFRQYAGWPIVEPAHMELAEPSIATAFRRCVEQGARLVVVFPYFLGPGRHWREDIPRLAAEAASPWKDRGVRHVVTAPLGVHPLVMQVIGERITQCLRRASGRGEGCDLCSDGGGCAAWS
ncbi:MAG: cobalamin biosynthesis protein CbiX [Planctomycetota bacterium]|nr:MAG: cobalamin biosynthesis protein CbiX [Planctomycetota bacterium]